LIDVQLWPNSHQRADVVPALRNSLAALQLDYVDMYLIHWPIALKVRTYTNGVLKHIYAEMHRQI